MIDNITGIVFITIKHFGKLFFVKLTSNASGGSVTDIGGTELIELLVLKEDVNPG